MAPPKRTPFSLLIDSFIINTSTTITQPVPPCNTPPLRKDPSILFTSLIKSYFQCGETSKALSVFEEMPSRDAVSWTTLISGYCSQNLHRQAIIAFVRMFNDGFSPNEYILSSVLKACKGASDVIWGRLVHGLAVKIGLRGRMYVGNCLLDMYADCCSSMKSSCAVFDEIEAKSVVSWTTLIAGYTHKSQPRLALGVFNRMMLEEERLNPPNPFTFSIAVRACASIGLKEYGQQMHSAIVKRGVSFSLPVMNSILDMYCRCGCLAEADQYFDEIPHKDLISWNTLISGYEKSDPANALVVFSQMAGNNVAPNCFTLTSVVAACADLAALNCGQQVHGGILIRGLENDMALSNSLIDMYAKCGSIAGACKVFDEMRKRDLLSWTSMMNGYGTHGYGQQAVDLFDRMIDSGIKPDQVVYMGVLSACSHAGLVNQGLNYFNCMLNEKGIKLNQEIYGCAVDLLGRAGRVEDAYQLIRTMPFEPDETVWGALLGAWKSHGFPRLNNLCEIAGMKPNLVGTYVMMSHIYAAEGRWREFAQIRKLMKLRGRRKETGKSWIGVGNLVCSFAVGSHTDCTYQILDLLTEHMLSHHSFLLFCLPLNES